MTDRQSKRDQFQSPATSRRKNLLLPALLLAGVALAVGGWLLLNQPAGKVRTVQADSQGNLRFAAADFTDGQARFFRYQASSGPVDFFLVRSTDGIIRAALDTCDVCYKARKGYRQEGADMICNNCDQHFRTDRINEVKGGCNPAPLARRLVGSEIVVAARDIEAGARYFPAPVN